MSESPSDLKYTETHEWVRIEGDVATYGITAHAAESLSDLVYIDLPKVGQTVSSGGSLGEIESVKAVSDLHCPVDGEVVEVNEELVDRPEVVNEDPHGTAWMVRIKFSDPGQVDALMTALDYQALIQE